MALRSPTSDSASGRVYRPAGAMEGPSDWSALGSLLVQEISETAQMDAPDETKFKVLSCRIRWVAVA